MFWKKSKFIAHVVEDKCRCCNYCIHICRHRVLTATVVDEKRQTIVNRPEKCTGCGKCAAMCPEQAIEMIEKIV